MLSTLRGVGHLFLPHEEMKNIKYTASIPSPFEDTTFTRQTRMGLIQPDGAANTEPLTAMVQVYAALFFEYLCDTGAER